MNNRKIKNLPCKNQGKNKCNCTIKYWSKIYLSHLKTLKHNFCFYSTKKIFNFYFFYNKKNVAKKSYFCYNIMHGLMVKRLRRRPLKAESRVRFSLRLPNKKHTLMCVFLHFIHSLFVFFKIVFIECFSSKFWQLYF